MRVNVFMIPRDGMTVIDVKDTVGSALKTINEKGLLSLPVVNGEEFVGVLSKGSLYEAFFNTKGLKDEEFEKQTIESYVKTDIESCGLSTRLEEAAESFLATEVRFIPVVDERNRLLGIITQQAVFKQYQSLFGSKYDSVTIVIDNYKGALGRIGEVISAAGGNITNFVQIDTDVMNLIELHISIDSPDFEKVLTALKKHKFDVREVIRK